MRAHTTRTALLVAAAATFALAACGGDGDDDDSGGPQAPPDSGDLAVTSPAFGGGEPIPVEYTCDGSEELPPLAIEGAPADAAELAVVVRDPDADGFVHWVVAGLPADTTEIASGPAMPEGTGDPALPEGAVEANNGFGEPGWAGPCPPEGNHTYELTVYALAESSGLAAGAEAEDGARAVEDTEALATATLRGTYERG